MSKADRQGVCKSVLMSGTHMTRPSGADWLRWCESVRNTKSASQLKCAADPPGPDGKAGDGCVLVEAAREQPAKLSSLGVMVVYCLRLQVPSSSKISTF